MLVIDIPGRGKMHLYHLVLDYNGTLARDGQLLGGVAERLEALTRQLHIHVITADTFGHAREQLKDLELTFKLISSAQGAEEKDEYIITLGSDGVTAIGNGFNDRLMLKRAELGVAVLGPEGAAGPAIAAADIITQDILSALDLLLKPKRLIATIRP